MRPKVEYKTKNRLVRVARDVSDELPEDRDVSFQESLEALLDHVEELEEQESESVEELAEQLGESGIELGNARQPQQSRDPFRRDRGGFTK